MSVGYDIVWNIGMYVGYDILNPRTKISGTIGQGEEVVVAWAWHTEQIEEILLTRKSEDT